MLCIMQNKLPLQTPLQFKSVNLGNFPFGSVDTIGTGTNTFGVKKKRVMAHVERSS